MGWLPRLFVAALATIEIACGSRTDLPIFGLVSPDAGADVTPKRIDRCAVYMTQADCVTAGCDFYTCITEPVDADLMPTRFACGEVNGPVPAACQ